MAFLDNSGDIILDAVLTDTGRARLARGDGSFNLKIYFFKNMYLEEEKCKTRKSLLMIGHKPASL